MKCSEKFKIVDRVLTAWFKKLGHAVGRRPGYFVIVPLFLTALAGTGFQRIHYEDDPEYLFSPLTGRAKQERAIVQKYFPNNFSAFNAGRMTDLGKFVRLLVTAKDGGTLFRRDVFEEVVQLDRLVTNVTVDSGESRWTFDDLCARWNGKCLQNSIVTLLPYLDDVLSGNISLTYPVWFSDSYDVFVFPAFLGSPEVSNEGLLGEVPALQLLYWGSNHSDFDINISLKWEFEVLRVLEEALDDFEHINIARFTSQTLQTELEDNTISIMPYMMVTVAIMVLFCIVTSMMGDWVRSKPLVGLLGVISATLATGTAFGILMYAGLPFIGINLAAPFLMLGIGIDDTFVMLAAWRRTRIQDSVPERLSHAYEEAAVSITITSLTDMFSFWVGAITPFPSVQIFCVYTGMSVVLTYLWHITFFGACMALFGYMEENGQHSVTFAPVLPVSESEDRSIWYRMFCSGGISKTDPWNKKDNKDHVIMVFFKDGVARLLNIPAIKAFVIMVFLVYLGVAIWGCTMVKEGLERRRLSKDNSYSVQFYDVEDKYFREHPYRVQIIVEGELNYFDPVVQEQVETLMQTFENSSYVEGDFYTESWLREWTVFVTTSHDILNINVTSYGSWLDSLKTIFLNDASQFSRDVAFDETGQKIVASRFIIQTKHVNNTLEDKDMMLELRRICRESELSCSIFHPLFVFFDQFVLVRTVSIQSISIAAGIMCVVSLIFIPNPICSLWVAFSILSIEIGVIGYMTLWDVNLDSISMINLIMCIGFSVDFSAHISYAYMSAHGRSADERVESCLHALGLPILQGGFSTILGVSTLYFAPSYIFVTFFKTNFLVIFFGMVHGIFLLPVLLSLFGPGSNCCGAGGHIEPEETDKSAAPPGGDGIYYLSGGRIATLHGTKACQLPLRIPRPQSNGTALSRGGRTDSAVRLQTGAFTVAEQDSPPPALAAKAEQGSLEKDLGLGTSGEDSSESSLSKGASKGGAAPAAARRGHRPKSAPLSLLEMYNNAGYVSDDETSSPRRPRPAGARGGVK
ncbi:patched domain-containing protein 3-like [Pollicipes pollicipes]|uniref:patched domain-containing protein 3-like n=1 Tax=Pollicipes pollicipes TaxID=41117 RepID=UPI001884A579|nr:patched domain-containing protein 3-like [Pollicipes pollicipes]